MRKQSIGFILLIIMISLIFTGCLTQETKTIKINEEQIKLQKSYDVIVIGGEPEGVAAAVSAARNGAKTLLIEKRDALGGLFTYGMLNYLDIPQGENGESVSKGIYEEWHKLVGGGNAFGIEEAKTAFKQLVDEEPNLTLLTDTEVLDSIVENNRITAIKIKVDIEEHEISAKTFIDATQDADFAVQSGAPYFVGREDLNIENTKMAVTLMIHLKNVDWEKVRETAKSEKFGPAEVTNSVAWGFTTLHFDYQPMEENTRLRGLNLAKVGDEYFINALQIFGVDGLDEQAKQDAIEKGKRETEHILQFLQAEFPGFEEAEIASFPPELYVRETRHIRAEYQLPMSDVWMNKDHWDVIAFGAYPVDIQAQSIKDYGRIISSPKQYAIPFRSLVPQEVDGLLVVGRSAGYSSLAAGSARVVPTGMATGEAAGAAASIAAKEDVLFRAMSKNEELIHKLQEKLNDQGAYVEHLQTDYPYQGEWYDEAIQTLFDYGLAFGGYNNDLKVDEIATSHAFSEIVKGVVERVNPSIQAQFSGRAEEIHTEIKEEENREVNRDEVVALLAEVFEMGDANWQSLIDKGMISEEVATRIGDNEEITYKEMYAIGASLIEYVKE